MEKQGKKSGRKMKRAPIYIVSALVGTAAGLCIVFFTPEEHFFAALAALFLGFIAAWMLQLMLHEAGHMLFGLLTGYRFASFRVGSLMWIARGGRVEFCRYKLAGTAGQCLMKPPARFDGAMPVMLYNLGGVIVNALTGVLGLTAGLCAGGLAKLFLLVWGFVGVGMALMNGVPIRAVVANDGANALALRRDAAARRAFWIQLKQVELMGDGVRLRDIPEAEVWFAMPADAELGNVLIAELAALRCNYLQDAGRFGDAARTIDHLLSVKSGLSELERMLLRCDRALCGALIGEEKERLIAMLDDESLQRILRAMRDMPGALCALYVRALIQGDAAAERLTARLEKIAKRYPYPGEIEAAREQMALARERLSPE